MPQANPLTRSMPTGRVTAARRERSALDRFCNRYGLDESPEAVAIYLTTLIDSTNGPEIRRHLELLDVERRLRGQRPWLENREIQTFLRGLHARAPIGPTSRGYYDPLYVELMHALVDATYLTSDKQRRAIAAAIIVAETGLPLATVARMTWNDLRVTKRSVTITVTRQVGRGRRNDNWRFETDTPEVACLVSALQNLPRTGPFILGERGNSRDYDRLREQLPPTVDKRFARTSLKNTIEAISQPSVSEVRDRALVLIGYGAGLRTIEAHHLRQQDVQTCEQGVVLTIEGRRRQTYVPRAEQERYDPVTAWRAWQDRMATEDKGEPEYPAFPTCNYSAIEARPLKAQGLNLVVHRRAEEAGLDGRFVWTSLRVGMIRTAIRNDARTYAVAAQVDLSSLGSIHRHEQRENLLRTNVARMLGL